MIFWEQQKFYKTDYEYQFFHGFYFGVLALVIFIFFFFYLLLREITFLYYIVYVFFQFMLQFSLEGFTFQYFFPNNTYLANNSVLISACGALFFLILYAKNFLKVPIRLPKWNTFYKIILLGTCFVFLFSLLPGVLQEFSYPIINIISLIGTVSIIAAIFVLKNKGYKVSNAFAVDL